MHALLFAVLLKMIIQGLTSFSKNLSLANEEHGFHDIINFCSKLNDLSFSLCGFYLSKVGNFVDMIVALAA